MSRKSLFKSESAAAIAIAAVLLLGLTFMAISVVKLNYAPEWKTDAERDYSYDAWSNMEDMKTRVDIFARFMGADINYPYGLSATVPFKMGGGDVPVFEPSKSNSKLAVNTEKCTMTITLAKYPLNNKTIDCGGVTYYSENRQYPDQVFRYENGALILAQGENSQMKRNPSFDIKKNNTSGNYTVIINAIDLIGEPASVSSSTSTALRLTGNSTKPFLNSSKDHPDETIDAFDLNISTRYTDAWTTYLNNTAKEKELVYNTDYTIESVPRDHVCISFSLTGKSDGIYVNKTEIDAEVGKRGGSLPSVSGNVMQLGTWYTFEISDNGTTIIPLRDYKTGFVFPVSSGTDMRLMNYDNGYTPNSFKHTLNTPFNETFRFNSFTKFESGVSKVTVRMIYRSEANPTSISGLSISGNYFDRLDPDSYNQQYWYLFNETRGISVNYPTELNLSINVDQVGGNKDIYIEYLAVRLD